MKRTSLLFLLLFLLTKSFAQTGRITDRNNIAWPQLFVFLPLDKKWGIHAEYQWRRVNGLNDGQQGLLRTAIQYKLNEQAMVQLGYAWVETYPYGDYPIAANGRFPEHRIYEQLSLVQPFNKLRITHRFRVEQRFLGKIKPDTEREIESWNYLNRFRYQLRAQQQLFTQKQTRVYGVFADELFIGAGKNTGLNVFDQNRLMLLAGIASGKHLQLETGFLQQIVQQGAAVNGRAVFQKNNGWLLAVYLTL